MGSQHQEVGLVLERLAYVLEVHNYEQFLESFASPKFHALWPAQAQVLSTYDTEYALKPDVAIELPTGSGKTLIALLIAMAWSREGKKVAILSANKTLARQLQQEAEALGIPKVLMEGRGIDILPQDRRTNQRASKISIMNYWFYFNQSPAGRRR
jgi:Rad3-related DNA helicase